MSALAHSRVLKVALLLLGGVTLLVLFFGEVLLAPDVYYPGDTARLYLPQRLAMQQALQQGRLPWWSADLGIGYPLLAEGEVGAWYPLNWLLVGLLPPLVALNLSVVLHFILAAWGCYLAGRKSGLSAGGASLGAVVFSLGGFVAAHQSHLSVLTVVAWLPWLFWLSDGLLGATGRGARWRWGLGLAMVTAIQFAGGHAQISLLGLMAVGLYALAHRQPRRWGGLACWLAALALGGIAAWPQLGPSLELNALSQRAGGLDPAFFTSYSFHPLLLATYLSPFLLGNPYPLGSVELMAYAGLLPLLLAWIALVRRNRVAPSRPTWFWVGLAVLGAALAFGRWNPAYALLRYVPVLNLFRVPARYLLWTSYALAMLAGLGYDALRARLAEGGAPARRWRWLPPAALAALTVAVLVPVRMSAGAAAPAAALVALWRWLPLPLVLLAALTVWLVPRLRPGPALALALGCLVVDLYAYGAVLDRTYNATWPQAVVAERPEAATMLTRQGGDRYRLYTQEEIMPDLAVARASLYPDMALGQGLASANLYMPLVPRAYQELLTNLSAEQLNRLNVRYVLIPQLLPVDAASELYDVENPFAALPYGEWISLPETPVAGIEVESYLSHAASLPDGALAATLRLRDALGGETLLPLRAGIESAEWAYERRDVAAVVAHALPEVAGTWPARSGYPPEDHAGHTYRATWPLEPPARLSAIRLEPALNPAFVRFERVWLVAADGQRVLLNHLAGRGDHEIIYRSEDVLVYRNNDALPRAYWLPETAVSRGADGLSLPAHLASAQVGAVDVERYEDMRVQLAPALDQPGYLVLADLHYPGWHVAVDGVEGEILPVDGLYRGVRLEPGAHRVVFTYRPTWGLGRR